METVTKILEVFEIDPRTEADFSQENQRNAVAFQKDGLYRLAIEKIGAGPCGLPAVSVAFYGEQNGDPMRSPEICFEVRQDGLWRPYYFRDDWKPVELNAYFDDDHGNVEAWLPDRIQTFTALAARLDAALAANEFVAYARHVRSEQEQRGPSL